MGPDDQLISLKSGAMTQHHLSPTQRQNQSATGALGSVHPKAGVQAPRVR